MVQFLEQTKKSLLSSNITVSGHELGPPLISTLWLIINGTGRRLVLSTSTGACVNKAWAENMLQALLV